MNIVESTILTLALFEDEFLSGESLGGDLNIYSRKSYTESDFYKTFKSSFRLRCHPFFFVDNLRSYPSMK